MLQLSHNLTAKTVSTIDLGIACEPPLIFEARTYLTRETLGLLARWDEDSDNPALTRQVAARLFINIQQDGQAYPLDSEAAIEGLIEALGSNGLDFVGAMVRGFEAIHFGFFQSGSKRSKRWPVPSENGTTPVSLPPAGEPAN